MNQQQPVSSQHLSSSTVSKDGPCYPCVEEAVTRACGAFDAMSALNLDTRIRVVAAMRQAARNHVKELSSMAVEETGLGRVEDKVRKNLLVTVKTPGPEYLEPDAQSGSRGLMLMERAPYGVIASIIPVTNPTATVINNGIAMISAGNAVVFNAHPGAKQCSNRCVQILNEAVISAGGPPDLLIAIPDPTIETAQVLMRHSRIALLCVTGGPGVVREAMNCGKKVIAAGAGNPPAVVDETADLRNAANSIAAGASLDNNIICTDEKVVVAVDSIAEELKRQMLALNCIEVSGDHLQQLCRVIFKSVNGHHGTVNTQMVGKNASIILSEAGIDCSPNIRLALCEVDRDHPLAWTEQLMPVLPIVRARDVDEAIALAVAFENGRRHTATMHSTNIEKLNKMARLANCSIFVMNGPSFAGLGMGGEGYSSFTIASPTGEGLTSPASFTRERRCTLVDSLRIV